MMEITNLSNKDILKKKKQLDILLTLIVCCIVIIITVISNFLWGTKNEPYVTLTIGHAFFPVISLGFVFLWFIKVRKYPLSFLGINKAQKKIWYLIAPLGAFIGFGIGIPSYIVLTKLFPALQGGGLASNPPELGYPLYLVLIVETLKYPIVSVIPHNILFRGAVIKSILLLHKRYFTIAFLCSTAFYIIYHLPFDFSFSAFYFNLIWNIIAVFLFIKSKSIFPPIIFHMFINYIGIMMSWGYHTFN